RDARRRGAATGRRSSALGHLGTGTRCSGRRAAGIVPAETRSTPMEPGPLDQAADAGSARSPTRILLVLDQPLVAELVKLTFNHGLFETRHAVSAQEALIV